MRFALIVLSKQSSIVPQDIDNFSQLLKFYLVIFDTNRLTNIAMTKHM